MSRTPLVIETFVEPTFGENCLVLSSMDSDGRHVGWVVDPSFPPQVHQVLGYLSDQGIALEKVILTHGHADHIAGVDIVREAHPEVQVLMGEPDQHMLGDAHANLSAPFGMAVTFRTRADGDLAPGMVLSLGALDWEVLDTSGHSPGGRSIYCAEAGVVVVGDALFCGSIGRTDFPGSRHTTLIANIRERLFRLPDDTVVHSGHGPVTTIGKERKSNPFVSDARDTA